MTYVLGAAIRVQSTPVAHQHTQIIWDAESSMKLFVFKHLAQLVGRSHLEEDCLVVVA